MLSMVAILYTVDLLFLLSVVIAPASWLLGSLQIGSGAWSLSLTWGWRPVLAPFVLFGIRTLLRTRTLRARPGLTGLWEKPIARKIALATVSAFVSMLIAEGILLWTGYEAHFAPIVVRGTQQPDAGGTSPMIPDAELIWKFNPGVDFNGRIINAMGFADREVEPKKIPGTVRVICMGDSVVGQGIPPYSGFLNNMLTNAPPSAQRWESFNMAVHGYSAVQGLRLFRKRTRELEPDVVTIQYGWNDHWLHDRPDRNRMAIRTGRLTGKLLAKLQHRRILQFLARVLQPSGSLAWSGEGPVLRVQPGEYRTVLTAFVRDIREAGAVPILITAPRAEKLTWMLVDNKQAESGEEAIRLHDEYTAITRSVAEREDAHLLDLALLFSSEEAVPLFARDGIHFKREGRIRMAGELYDVLCRIAGQRSSAAGVNERASESCRR